MSQPTSDDASSITELSSDELEEFNFDKEIDDMGNPRIDEAMLEAEGAANIESILDELEITEAVAGEPIEALSEDEVRGLDGDLAKAEAYEEQPAAAEGGVSAPEVGEPGVETKAKKARVAKAKKDPVVRDLNALPASAFQLFADDSEDNKAAVIAARPAQKKIAEKFDNVILSAHQGKSPSKYVTDCFGVLNAKTTVTSSELVAAMMSLKSNKGTTYDEGTARSQVGQIMALFPALGIAKREKQTLTINEDSRFVEILRARLS